MVQTVSPRSHWLVAGIITLVLMIAVIQSSRSYYFATPLLEQGDAAVNALQIDNAKHGREIYGNYSRFQFNHPGPVLFYVYAASEIVLRDWLGLVPAPHNAHLLSSLAVQVCCFALALAILLSWFDSWVFLAVALLAGMAHFSQVARAFNSIWPPDVLVMPFLCFLTAASSFAAGRTRDLAVVVVTGGMLFHGHVAQPLFVGGLGATAAFLHWRREKKAAAWPGARAWAKSHRGLLSFCGAWAALMLLPLVIDVCTYGLESNVATIVRRFLANTAEHKSILQSLLYFLSFPTYSISQEDFFTELNASSFRFFLDHVPMLLLWLVATAGPAALGWSRRKQLPAPLRGFLGTAYVMWAATALLCVVWGLLQAEQMAQFNGVFYHAVFYFLVLLGLGVLAHFFGRLFSAPAVVLLCCLATVIATMGFRLEAGPNEESAQRIRQGIESALARHPAGRPVLLVFEHYGWPDVIPIALELQRRGIPFYTWPSWNFMTGRRHDVRLLGPETEKAAAIWWVTTPAPDGVPITRELAIFTEPAPLDPHATLISFAKQANGFRHLVSGVSVGNVEHAWTEQPAVALAFKPLPATTDVQLVLEAQNNPQPGAPNAPQRAEVFFNGVALGTVAASEHRHFSLVVPQTVWNSTPRAKLELRFPDAIRFTRFTKPANPLWAAWGLWSVSFATPGQPAPGMPPEAKLAAELPPVEGRIDFTAKGNLNRYRSLGLEQPSNGSTRTSSSRVELLFRPIPTDREVELQIVAEPFAADGTARPLPCRLFFNDKLLVDAPFVGPGVMRAAIPAILWNSRAINTLSLELPGVTVSSAGQPSQGLDIRWLRTGPLEGQP